MARSPYTVSARVRGIGVAVSASMCGSPPLPLACSAARWPTPKRCCSSTIASPSRGNVTASLMTAWVPITTSAMPAADRVVDLPLARRRERAGQELGAHAEAVEQRREAGVVLAGEDLGRRHERRLPARRAPRTPAPRPPPPSCRCRRRPAAAGASAAPSRGRRAIVVDGRGLVAGQREGQRARRSPATLGLVDRDGRRAELVARPAGLGQRQLEREQLVEGEPVERRGDVGRLLREVRRAAARRRGPAGRRAPHRSGGRPAPGSDDSRIRASSSRSRFWVTPAARW